MSSWPSRAVDGIAAAASFGSSFLSEQAASVIAALQASTIKLSRDGFLADPDDMACPFFYGWPGVGPSALRSILCLRRSIRFLLRLRRALRPAPGHGGLARSHAGIVLGIRDHGERHV